MVYEAKEKYSSSILPFSSRTVFDAHEKEVERGLNSQAAAGSNSLLKMTSAVILIFRLLIKNALSIITEGLVTLLFLLVVMQLLVTISGYMGIQT